MTPAEIAAVSGSGPHDEAYFASFEAADSPTDDDDPRWNLEVPDYDDLLGGSLSKIRDEMGGFGVIIADFDPHEAQAEAAARKPHDEAPQALVRLARIDASPPPPLLIDRLDPRGHTILFGTGDVGKGTLAASWITRWVESNGDDENRADDDGKPLGLVLILDYENHPGEWARRIGGLLKNQRDKECVTWAGPLRHDWTGPRGPIWSQVDYIRRIIEKEFIEVVVVDSIVPACGGADALESGTPGRYAGALQALGVPVLSLAHVTKEHDQRYPFGSIFWHNLARVSWSLSRTAGGRLELVNRKSNNYEKRGRFEVSVTWHEGELREVWERPYSAALGERIDEVLADGPLTATEITDRLNEECDVGEEPVKLDSVGRTLRRGLAGIAPRYEIAGTGKTARWARR